MCYKYKEQQHLEKVPVNSSDLRNQVKYIMIDLFYLINTDIYNGREDELGRAELVIQLLPRSEFWIVLSPSNKIR